MFIKIKLQTFKTKIMNYSFICILKQRYVDRFIVKRGRTDTLMT